MTLKELSQLYYLNREIQMDRERQEALRAKEAAPGSPDYSGMPKSHNHENRIERYTAEIMELDAIISAKIIQSMVERRRIERYIADIPDSLTRQIFTLRFVDGLSWLQVAYKIGGDNTEDSVKKTCYRYIKNSGK